MDAGLIKELVKAGVGVVAVVAICWVFLVLGGKMLDNQKDAQDLNEDMVEAVAQSAAAQKKLAETIEKFYLIWSGAKPAN